jgi:hypothetical protein
VDPPPSASEVDGLGKEPGAGSATVFDLPQEVLKHMDNPEGKWTALYHNVVQEQFNELHVGNSNSGSS